MRSLPRRELGLLILLIVLCTIMAFRSPFFLTAANLQNTFRLIGIFGIFSLGAAFVIITGGIDLSVGSMLALVGTAFWFALREWAWNPFVAVLFALGLAVALGSAHAWANSLTEKSPCSNICTIRSRWGWARMRRHSAALPSASKSVRRNVVLVISNPLLHIHIYRYIPICQSFILFCPSFSAAQRWHFKMLHIILDSSDAALYFTV